MEDWSLERILSSDVGSRSIETASTVVVVAVVAWAEAEGYGVNG